VDLWGGPDLTALGVSSGPRFRGGPWWGQGRSESSGRRVRRHRQSIIDWEIGAAFRTWRDEHGEKRAIELIRQKGRSRCGAEARYVSLHGQPVRPTDGFLVLGVFCRRSSVLEMVDHLALIKANCFLRDDRAMTPAVITLWGAFIRFTLVSRAFGPGAEPGFGPWKAPEIRRRTRRHPFEVEREALRVGPRVLNRTRPSRATGRPVGELAPIPMSCPPASKDTRSAARSQ